MRAAVVLLAFVGVHAVAQELRPLPDRVEFIAGWANMGVIPQSSEPAYLIWQAMNAECTRDIRSHECQALAELHDYKFQAMRKEAAFFAKVSKQLQPKP